MGEKESGCLIIERSKKAEHEQVETRNYDRSYGANINFFVFLLMKFALIY